VFNRRIQARLQRQKFLQRPNGPESPFIIDGAAIHRHVRRNTALMRAQLESVGVMGLLTVLYPLAGAQHAADAQVLS
jgi:hypothetical protein